MDDAVSSWDGYAELFQYSAKMSDQVSGQVPHQHQPISKTFPTDCRWGSNDGCCLAQWFPIFRSLCRSLRQKTKIGVGLGHMQHLSPIAAHKNKTTFLMIREDLIEIYYLSRNLGIAAFFAGCGQLVLHSLWWSIGKSMLGEMLKVRPCRPLLRVLKTTCSLWTMCWEPVA